MEVHCEEISLNKNFFSAKQIPINTKCYFIIRQVWLEIWSLFPFSIMVGLWYHRKLSVWDSCHHFCYTQHISEFLLVDCRVSIQNWINQLELVVGYGKLWIENLQFHLQVSNISFVFYWISLNQNSLQGGITPLELPKGKIVFRNVAFTYPSREDIQIFKDLSLEIAPGTLVAVVGPSGSGKSTLAALLLRLYDPSKGTIFLDDYDIQQLDPVWLKKFIGTVAQVSLKNVHELFLWWLNDISYWTQLT